ncbi:hypothetical protein MMC25_001276 [Agyrium rufum]|nr:hypothetical protein [Agyrium rufum]
MGMEVDGSSLEFWNARISASGMAFVDTRIPLLPDQTEFLEKWFEWHQGYAVVKREDGSEEHVPLVGESLREVDVGFLPRTAFEIQEAAVQRSGASDQVRLSPIQTEMNSSPPLLGPQTSSSPHLPEASSELQEASLLLQSGSESSTTPHNESFTMSEHHLTIPLRPGRTLPPATRRTPASSSASRETAAQERQRRLWGTREEMERQGAQYVSPVGGLFDRAEGRYLEAERRRRAGRDPHISQTDTQQSNTTPDRTRPRMMGSMRDMRAMRRRVNSQESNPTASASGPSNPGMPRRFSADTLPPGMGPSSLQTNTVGESNSIAGTTGTSGYLAGDVSSPVPPSPASRIQAEREALVERAIARSGTVHTPDQVSLEELRERIRHSRETRARLMLRQHRTSEVNTAPDQVAAPNTPSNATSHLHYNDGWVPPPNDVRNQRLPPRTLTNWRTPHTSGGATQTLDDDELDELIGIMRQHDRRSGIHSEGAQYEFDSDLDANQTSFLRGSAYLDMEAYQRARREMSLSEQGPDRWRRLMRDGDYLPRTVPRPPSPERGNLDADDGRPPPLNDEKMKVDLTCHVCFSQIANVACLPCGKSSHWFCS